MKGPKPTAPDAARLIAKEHMSTLLNNVDDMRRVLISMGALCRVLQDRSEHEEAVPGELWWGFWILLQDYADRTHDTCSESIADVSKYLGEAQS